MFSDEKCKFYIAGSTVVAPKIRHPDRSYFARHTQFWFPCGLAGLLTFLLRLRLRLRHFYLGYFLWFIYTQ